MHYVFTYIRNSIQNSVTGSIQDNINIDYLSQLDFKVPPKSYQDKVVGVLGTIDEKIDTNTRICTELEAIHSLISRTQRASPIVPPGAKWSGMTSSSAKSRRDGARGSCLILPT